jgi:hypothetical protein
MWTLFIRALLGQKPNGKDEYSFYSFFQMGWSLQDWLASQAVERGIRIIQRPTTDSKPIEKAMLASVSGDIRRLLGEGRTVVLMDSGGVQRTGQVCRHLGAVLTSGVRDDG